MIMVFNYYPHISNYLPSSTFKVTRSYSTFDRTIVHQLFSDIEFLYDHSSTKYKYIIRKYRLGVIKEQIESGLYVLSPLKVKFLKKNEIGDFLYNKIKTDSHNLIVGTRHDIDHCIVVMIENQEDLLVIMGLNRMLFRLSYGYKYSILLFDHLLRSHYDSFFHNLKQIGKVDRVYKINLDNAFNNLSINILIDKLKYIVGNHSIFKLISSFIHLPIIDDEGKYRPDISSDCIPPVGDIMYVLQNLILMEIFDSE